jgi:1,4-alpha-glucan branching enzyme
VKKLGFVTAQDLEGFSAGRDGRAFEKLGARLGVHDGAAGAYFAVWAPEAFRVEVVGDFNGWSAEENAYLTPIGSTGVWQGFIRGIKREERYKYRVRSRHNGYVVDKADPYGFLHEVAPGTASLVWSLENFGWTDSEWLKGRAARQTLDAPISIYEVHLGSWRRVPEQGNRSLGYREIAAPLADHVLSHGFTHVELMPIAEHPFFGSWGYEITGYFAPTHRYGKPEDFMYLVDYLHQRGIGVILDWVPAHFPADEHGLVYFDGTHLYEHADPRQGFHPEWKSQIFNYGRNEVKSFLLSSALFWLDVYHADGLRVDGVASMLFRDYGRKDGEWVANEHGGRENLEAVAMVRAMNESVYLAHPGAQTFAEESTTWPDVSKPVTMGGLGFGFKWDMGWMHDTLKYLSRDPIARSFHHDELTFRSMYAYSENFVLPLSHDEVVHGKGSLWGRMPGDDWQKAAGLRALYAWMWAHPGKKLLFMGGELGQPAEWQHEHSLDWHLLSEPLHAGVQRLVRDLNRRYGANAALHQVDFAPAGFEWIQADSADVNVYAFQRRSHSGDRHVVCVANLSPVPRIGYRMGLPEARRYVELLNTDAGEYGGSGVGNLGAVQGEPRPWDGLPASAEVNLPPLGVLWLEPS